MNLVEQLPSWVTMGIQGLAAGVVAFAAVEALARSFAAFVGRGPEAARIQPEGSSVANHVQEAIRLRFACWLVIALELGLAAAVLRAATSFSWTNIGQLGAIVAVRIGLNNALQCEIKRADRRLQTIEAMS